MRLRHEDMRPRLCWGWDWDNDRDITIISALWTSFSDTYNKFFFLIEEKIGHKNIFFVLQSVGLTVFLILNHWLHHHYLVWTVDGWYELFHLLHVAAAPVIVSTFSSDPDHQWILTRWWFVLDQVTTGYTQRETPAQVIRMILENNQIIIICLLI